MTYTEPYIKRLLRLAHHLASGQLHKQYVPMIPPAGRTAIQPPVFQTDKGLTFDYFTFVTTELPYLFPGHWDFDKEESPFLLGRPDLPTHQACASFLGLSPTEFFHIAIPNAQKRQWGGITLAYNAAPQDVSHNILELIGMHIRMN